MLRQEALGAPRRRAKACCLKEKRLPIQSKPPTKCSALRQTAAPPLRPYRQQQAHAPLLGSSRHGTSEPFGSCAIAKSLLVPALLALW